MGEIRAFNRFVVVGALAMAGSAACSKKSARLDELRYRLPTDPPSIDWSLATDNVSREVIQRLHEGLLEQDANTRIKPALAESWTISSDGKNYSFKLRPGLKWSDGKDLVAQDFVDGWERLLNPASGAEYAYMLFDLVNAEAYQKGSIKDFTQVGVKASDARTLEVRLRRPVAHWIHLPTFWVTYPIRKDLIAQHGNRWTDADKIVSAGPYVLKTFERDSKAVLERNPNYWDKSKVGLARIAYRVVKDDSTAVSLFNSGDLDIVRDLPTIQLKTLAARGEFLSAPFLRGYYIGLNIKDKNVSDVKVRQAIAMATNRDEIQKVVGAALANPLNSWIPPGLLGHNKARGLGFNADAAKKLWADIKNKPTHVELWFDQKELNKLVAENLQSQWKRTLGLEVKIVSQEWKVYLKTLHTKAPSLYRMGWGADYPDPDTFMSLFTCQSGNNQTGLCDARYDELIGQAGASTSPAVRAMAYDEAQKILLEEQAAIIPLFSETNLYLVSPKVTGFKVNAMGDYQIKDVTMDGKARGKALGR